MGKTVLVVDDSVSMRQMVSFTLTGAGYEVVEAGDGKEAVDKLNGGANPIWLLPILTCLTWMVFH